MFVAVERSMNSKRITQGRKEQPMERWRFILSGRVQNVGLRVRAYLLSREFPVTGRIANLNDDDKVELELQGEKAVIDKYFEKLCKLPFVRIDDVEVERIPIVDEDAFNMQN